MMCRFSSEQKILDTLVPLGDDMAGIVLYEKNGVNYGLAAGVEKHVLVSGATRSGKTSRVSIPMVYSLLNTKDSAIIVDSSRKDIYKAVAGYALRQGTHKVYHLDLTSWESPDSYNPLLHIWNQISDADAGTQDQGYRDAEQFGRILVAEQEHDRYWEEAGAQFISGMLLGLFELAKEEQQINLSSLQAFGTESLRKVGGRTVLEHLVELLPPDSKAAPLLSMVVNSATQTAGSIFSVAMSAINKLCVGDIGMDTFYDPAPSITVEKLEKDPFMLFMTLPENGETAIGVVILAQLLNHFIRAADRNKNGRLDKGLHVILEEMGVVGPYLKKDLPRYTSTCLGRNIKFAMICQSLAQLDHTFGVEGARIIRSNSGACLCFGDNDPDACEQVSRMCGKYPVFTSDVPAGVMEFPRILPEEVRGLSVGEALVTCGRLVYVTHLPLYTRLFLPGTWEGDPLPFHFREYPETLHPLDLVEEKRKAEMEALRKLAKEGRKIREKPERENLGQSPVSKPVDGLNHMTIPEAIEEAQRRRQVRGMYSQFKKQTGGPPPKKGLRACVSRLFRKEKDKKEGAQ